MYLIIRDDEIIAAHEECSVVEEYLSYQKNPDKYRIIKLKKKKSAEASKADWFQDVYLVEYKDKYVPSEYYEYLVANGAHWEFDMTSCRNTLVNLLTSDAMPEKMKRAYKRVIEDLTKRISDAGDVSEETLRLVKDFEEEYKHAKDRWG